MEARRARFVLRTSSATMLLPSKEVVGKEAVDKAVKDLFENAQKASRDSSKKRH